VGYATFATEQQAVTAQEAYNLWQGFGQGGLLVELLRPEPARTAMQMGQPQYRGTPPQKRPLQEALGASVPLCFQHIVR